MQKIIIINFLLIFIYIISNSNNFKIKAHHIDDTDTILSNKIVCVNISEIIQKIPDFIIAQNKIKNIAEIYNLELHKILKNFHKKSHLYEKEAAYKNNLENRKRGEELLVLKKRAEKYQKHISEELEKKQNLLFIPIYKKIENAIKTIISKDKNIIRVDDSSPGKGILIIRNIDLDITYDVLKELKIYNY